MCVGNICRRDVVTIAPQASLEDAARLMRERHVGMVVVVEPSADGVDQMVQGVLTDRDIVVSVLGRGADPKDLKVFDVMTREPHLAVYSQSLATVLQLMRARGIHRVPVVGERGELVGVLSIDDALDMLALQLTAIAGAVRDEQSRERKLRP
jgi:CBS domain-containing protein